MPSTFLRNTALMTIWATLPVAHATDFDKDIRPLLKEHCVECHGATKQKGGLRLDAKAFALKGGDNGAVIVAKDAEHSDLWQRIASPDEDERMPPKGERLNATQVALIRDWIRNGAAWPESQTDRDATADRRLQHWAFQPVKTQAIPATLGKVRNPIDAFINAKLQEKSLQPSPEADRRTLIRRLSFDLLGLPPSPEEVTAFIQDQDPRAYEKLVDRLLDSPHYGERWARHWLDIAHYADTHGFERDQLRPNAWRYRDYVIDAFNKDRCYDQFIREQIAGDMLAPDRAESIIATGFLAAGPWDFVGQMETPSPVLKRAARAGDLDDILTQVITSTMGLTINCARCHDHKLDPITQKEYYQLTSIFAGVKRAEREIDVKESTRIAGQKAAMEKRLIEVSTEIGRLSGAALDLADMVGGGNGRGTGVKGSGLLLSTGAVAKTKLAYHKDFKPNQFNGTGLKNPPNLVQGVFLPKGPAAITLPDGIVLRDIPKTSGHAWDAIRNGALNSQVTTLAAGVDYAAAGHSMLGLHANSGITFSLAEMRRAHGVDALRFSSVVAFGAQASANNTLADFTVYVDGEIKARRLKMRKNETALVDIPLPATAKFLTLMATDGGDGIGHDLLYFGDARVRPDLDSKRLTEAEQTMLKQLQAERLKLDASLRALPQPLKVYAITTEKAPAIHILRRGNPEDALEPVTPGAIASVRMQPPTFSKQTESEGDGRKVLAEWITHADNPLTRRVLVNRLWHHHFGQGLVNTPSDFGLGGDRPSHPELLDWLAAEFLRSGWSVKAMHRLMCTSATYRQTSVAAKAGSSPNPTLIDASNRLLWRQNPRRLDAESLRDAVLAVSGNLNLTRGGPGFRDFDYTEAYAPIYRYTTADKPELWRRSIYRFVVRTTPHQFLTTLDCPDPANFTPARVVTTTALQALTLSNNAFMLQQADHLAKGISQQTGLSPLVQITRAFERTFQRPPNQEELLAAASLAKSQGLFSLCRMLINANEFVYID